LEENREIENMKMNRKQSHFLNEHLKKGALRDWHYLIEIGIERDEKIVLSQHHCDFDNKKCYFKECLQITGIISEFGLKHAYLFLGRKKLLAEDSYKDYQSFERNHSECDICRRLFGERLP
jgi:hypothetical protein